MQVQVGWSVEGLQRMERHGRLHLPALFHIQLEQYESAGADCLQQVTFAMRWHVQDHICAGPYL